MGFKRHTLSLMDHASGVVIFSVGLGWASLHPACTWPLYILFLILTGIFLLFKLLTRTQNEILFFFKALENDDSSVAYRSNHRSRFIDELHRYLNVLNESFREMKLNHEVRERYFSQILENLSSGMLVISKTGHVNHINQEALRLFNLPQLTHIKALSEKDEKLHTILQNLKPPDKHEVTLQDQEVGLKKVLDCRP